MFTAYTPSFNAGRFDASKVYTLANILKLRNSLAGGVIPGSSITVVPGATVLLDEGISFLISLVKGNATELGSPKSIDKISADTIINRLELMRGTKGLATADGNTRSLAILLHYGLTGETITYPVVECQNDDPRVASFRANVATSMSLRMEWKARTAFVMSLLEADPNLTESEIQRSTGLGRGTSQHATASAVAVLKHGLELSKCVSLTASEWRLVRDVENQAEACTIAYSDGARLKAFSPKMEAQTFITRNGAVGIYAKLLQAMVDDDLQTFRKILVDSLV